MEDYDCVIFLSQKDKKKGEFLFYDPWTDDEKIIVKNKFEVEFDSNDRGELEPIRIKIGEEFSKGREEFVQHKKFYSMQIFSDIRSCLTKCCNEIFGGIFDEEVRS